jgi:hypothetical protein
MRLPHGITGGRYSKVDIRMAPSMSAIAGVGAVVLARGPAAIAGVDLTAARIAVRGGATEPTPSSFIRGEASASPRKRSERSKPVSSTPTSTAAADCEPPICPTPPAFQGKRAKACVTANLPLMLVKGEIVRQDKGARRRRTFILSSGMVGDRISMVMERNIGG